MANNINELYDSLSDDPLFTTNFKSADDLETYLKTPENVKDFRKVYGAELDETQLMGLKKKEDTSSSSSVSVGAEPMVETPPMGVQDNNPVLGAADQGIDLSGQPLPEMGYGKGLVPVKPVQPKDKAAVDYYSSEIKKFKDGIDKGSFQSLGSFQKFSSDPYFKQLKAEGYFDQDLKAINDSFNKNIYSKSKGSFDNPTTKKQLSEVGIIPTEIVDFKKASAQVIQKNKETSALISGKPPVQSDRQKLFENYLSMYQDPYKTAIEEETQNALVDSELLKDAERIIKEGKWNFDTPTPENQANSDAKGFIFENDDLIKEVNPIYIGQQVEKYVNNPISGAEIPDDLKPIVIKRLERLLLANAEEKLKVESTEQKVRQLLAAEGKTLEQLKNIPNEAIKEIESLSNQPLAEAQEFKQQATETINTELEALSSEQKLRLDQIAKDIKYKADNQMYASEEEYKQDYAQYVEDVNNANVALNTKRLELIAAAEKQFGAQNLTAQQDKKEKLQEIYTKYGITEKDGKLTFKDLQKLEGIYNKAYSEYDKDKENSRRAIQTAQFQGWRPGGTLDWFGDRLLGRTANVLTNIVESVDAAVGVENNPLSASLKYLQFVEANNRKSSVSITDSRNASDVLEASLGTIVDQVPNMALGVTAAVLTKNPYIGGSIAWAQDTQEQVGQNYRDNFRATGSESEAREAAASTLKLQTAMYPAYLLQFAPFMEGFFSTAKGITLKTVTSDIAKFAGTEYAPELITELAQNYKNAKDSRNSKYENMTFSQYALEEGPKLALEILPSVAAMTGTGMAYSRIQEQSTQKQVDAFKSALGERGMMQAVADAIDVMGEKSVFYIPEHFLMTGQITPEQFGRFRQEMSSLVSTYPQVRDTIQNDEKSKFYLDLMEQKKKVEAFAETIPDGELKDMFKAKAENIKKTMQDIINGRDVKYTVFKGQGGFMYVTDNQTASQMINKQGTYSDAISEGAVEVISSDEAVNNRVKDLQKNLATGAQQVEGISTGTNVNAATVDNTEARNKVVEESARDKAEVERLFEDAKTVESAIGNILPNVRVVVHTGTSFAEKMNSLGRPDLAKAKGFYAFDRRGGKFVSEIIINADLADDTTIAHEASHGVLLAEFGNNPETFAAMKKQLEQIVSASDNKKLNDFIKGYSEISKPEEYLVQLTAILKSEGKNLSPGILNKIALMINDIFKKLGINIVPFKNVNNTQEVVDYFNSLSASLAGGQQIERKNAVQEQTTGQVSVQPEATTGQEVVQGKPQTEPQVPTEKSEEEKAIEQAGEMEEGSVPLTPEPLEINPDIFAGKASQGEKITIPSEDLLGGKQVNVGEIFAKFKEENGRNPRVWVWMGDQLKRGEYFNPETGVKHFLEGGFNFANDPTNIANGDIWATGLDRNLLETRLPNCDFIWIMSGSPSSSYNFSKGTSKVLLKEINAGFEKLVGETVHGVKINKAVDGDYFADFVKIAENILPTNTKKWDAFLEAIKNPNMLDTSARKVFAETLLHQGGGVKISLPFQKFLHEELGIPTRDKFDTLAREKFLVDNNFTNGDLGILLKPNGQANYNNNVHDTYGSTIKGEVVGFPDRKMNVMNVLPKEALTVTSNKTGAVIENPSSPAVIKTAVGDLGKIYDSGDIDTFLGKAQKVRSEKSSGTTQVATTTGSYVKAANLIKDIQGDVLDYGAGLGLGTDAMSNTLGRKVDSYEPNPERWQGKEEATYTASDQIGKKYDGIVSLNVLNVVPKDIRDAIVTDIFNKLNDGGKAVISTRKWSGDVNGAKNAVPGAEEKSLIITRRQDGKDVEVFQKGFDGNELVDYVQSLLGDQANVVKNTTFGANGVIITKNSTFSGKAQLNTTNIGPEYNADIAAGNTATEAMKNLLAQGYSYNQIGDQLGRANIQESYNAAIAEMGKEVAAKYSDTQEVRLKEIEDYLGANPVSVEQLRADLIGLGYADLEIFTAMNRNLFSQSELFQAFGETYRQTVQNAIADSRYPTQDLTEVAEDTRSIKVTQSVSDLTDNFADFSFIDANVLVEHMVNTVKKSGLVEAANALAEHLKGKNVDQIPQALLNFSQLTSIAGRILVMARMAKKDMSDLVIGSIERGPIRISDATKQKIKQLVSEYNLKSDVYTEARETFGKDKDDTSFTAMLNAEAEFYQAGDNLMEILEKLKLRYWNDVLTSFSTRALLSIATTPLSLWGNIEQGILGQVSSPVRAAISKVKKASKKTNRLSFADYWNGQRLASKKGVGETWAIISEGKYTTPDMAEKYMDGIADVNAQKDYMDSIKFIGDMIGSQMTKMTDEEFASAYDKLMYETSKGDIKLTNGKTYTVGSAMFRAVMGTIPEITGRMLAISGDRIAFHGYKTRALMDYVRMVEQEVKSGKRDTELQKYIAEELGGSVKNSDMDLLINLSTVLSDYSEFGKEESLKRVFMNDNFATNLMGGARKGLKNRITEQYFKYLTAPTATSKVFAGLKKAGYQGLDVATWTVSPFTRVPVNVLAAGMQNTIPFVSPLFAIASYSKLKTASDAFNKKYGANLEAAMKSESAQKQYEKDRQELFEKRRQHNYNLSAVATSAAVASVVLSMALSGALTPPAGADDEDRRKALNAMGLRPSEFNITYYSEWLSASPEQREKMMINRGWKQGDKVLGYQNMGLIGQTMGYFSSNAYDFGKEKVKKASYIKSMQPTISGISSFFSLGESSIQNISALQTIGLALDISKAKDQQKAAEKLIANMVAATGAVAAPNALNFFAKGQAQTQMSLGQVIPSQEQGGIAMLGRVGIQAAAKLSKNSQVFGRKTDYFQSGIGVFGEELKLNLTGMEPGTGAAYFSAALNPFGLRSFKQVKQGDKKADFANNLYSTVMGMSMVSDELGLMDEKGRPLNMWSVLSINKDNSYEIGEGVNKVTLSLPFDLYRKELQTLGELRYNGMVIHIENFQNNLEQMRSNPDNNANIEKLARATFETMRNSMTNSLNTYESELTSLRLRGILTEMDKRGLITAEDKKRIEIALPGQFIK